jgi:hypothetical protein
MNAAGGGLFHQRKRLIVSPFVAPNSTVVARLDRAIQ